MQVGHLNSATQNGASVAYNYLTNSGLLSGQSLHNGAFEQSISYETKRNLPTSIAYKKGSSTLAARNYVFDAIGRITNRTQQRAGESTRADSFSYNDRNELTSATLGSKNYDYDFDNLGSRKTSTEDSKTSNYTVNELNQYTQTTSNLEPSTFDHIYDADGNQTLIRTETGIWQVEYNAENRPVKFVQGTKEIECKYDYMGRRFEKVVKENGSITDHRYFVYDGYLQIANFKVDTGIKNLDVSTFWDPSESKATRPVSLTLVPNAQRLTPEIYYYSHDYTKNICELFSVDEQNNVNIVRSYDYSPFGSATEHIVDSAIVNLENNFRFSSEFYDSEMALCYYNYRHYNPLDGRWIARDPIEEQGGLNLYGFVANNVVNSLDLLGYGFWDSVLDWLGVIPLIGTAINIVRNYFNGFPGQDVSDYSSCFSKKGWGKCDACIDTLRIKYTTGAAVGNGARSFVEIVSGLIAGLIPGGGMVALGLLADAVVNAVNTINVVADISTASIEASASCPCSDFK